MSFFIHVFITICTALPNILGYNLIFGKGKIFHFGPLGCSIVTAYTGFLTLSATQSWVLAFIAAGIASALLSSFFTWLSFRLDPDGLGILSLAVHLTLLTIVLNWSSVTRGAQGLPNIPRIPGLETQGAFAIAMLIVAGSWVAFLMWLDSQPFARRMSALAESQWQAAALGISRAQTHFWAFLIGGMGAVLTNMAYHQYIRLVYPSDFSYQYFIFMILVVVAGKPGNALGVTISVALITALKEGLRFLPLSIDIVGPMRLLLYGVILLLAVWWRRESLFPKRRSI